MEPVEPPEPPEPLLTPRAAAARLGVAVSTLATWADAGRLRAQRTAGGQRRYLEADVERLRLEGLAAGGAVA